MKNTQEPLLRCGHPVPGAPLVLSPVRLWFCRVGLDRPGCPFHPRESALQRLAPPRRAVRP